jgi:hypothetical protein
MDKQDFIRRIVESEEFKLVDGVVHDPNQVSSDGAVQAVRDKTMAALAAHGINDPHNGYALLDYDISLALMEMT